MLKSIIILLKKRAIANQTFRELNSLSDRELQDLGISRYNIQEIANQAYDLEIDENFNQTHFNSAYQ
jgi:uncharacterized protein YjiS (DUF1127 family)